jgi:acyl-CoA synthetase (AMP-forming)/AMP-acid ligase II
MHAGQRFALFHQDTLHFAAAMFGAWLAGKTVYLPSDTLPATCRCCRRRSMASQETSSLPRSVAGCGTPVVDDGHALACLGG